MIILGVPFYYPFMEGTPVGMYRVEGPNLSLLCVTLGLSLVALTAALLAPVTGTARVTASASASLTASTEPEAG